MRLRLSLRMHSVLPMFLLSLLFGFAPGLSAAGADSRSPGTPRQVRPVTLRWSEEQKEVLAGMQQLAAEARFRLPAQRYEQEVRLTEPALRRAQALLQEPAGDPSAYDDAIRQLRQHQAKLLQLQNELTATAGQRRPPRGNPQLTPTPFENANQKGTQYTNILGQVLKTLNEMRIIVIRNLP